VRHERFPAQTDFWVTLSPKNLILQHHLVHKGSNVQNWLTGKGICRKGNLGDLGLKMFHSQELQPSRHHSQLPPAPEKGILGTYAAMV
jgi:hypothetical protein